jgi:hypothetical protein
MQLRADKIDKMHAVIQLGIVYLFTRISYLRTLKVHRECVLPYTSLYILFPSII